ncbi:protein FAM83B-like [Centroberyx affinis]|uniref:protein FAM83B-like n=1 Tax=Centroberyx affinis TaxID=166261 RepID=UPI003A5C6A0E
MESNLSCLSSLKDEVNQVFIQPHYKESYRLAIYALLCGGKEAYEEFLKAEQISHFLSEEEILFILENAELPVPDDDQEGNRVAEENGPSTYFPTESDEEVPDLDLGWPLATQETSDTNISLLFHPPRQNAPSIKEVIRKQIQDAKQLIAIAMDVFTDVDIFREIINVTLRGVVVYVLLDDSQFESFLTMSQRVGVQIQDLKNIRVRTVQGQQYQCRSGAKFHGALEQKFILVDCKTVLYGTYSYKWSYEKINLSMVLVITGQLVCSYDEEFRRLFARSAVPAALSREKASDQYLWDAVALHSPNSSQLSLYQIHIKSRLMHGLRSAQNDLFNNGAMLTRGLSVQERLHQSHRPDMGMVKGHSYAGELQRINSMTRLRTVTRDVGVPVAPGRTGSNLWGGEDSLRTGQTSQLYHKHRTRYGADQHLLPYSSETSLHRWKIDSYLNNNDAPLDSSSDVISPCSSHLGLNENQPQLLVSRSRDIKSRFEEIRQKRPSLQECTDPRQSQESLRYMYSSLERSNMKSSLRALDTRQTMAELEPDTQYGSSLERDRHREFLKPGEEPKEEGPEREQVLTPTVLTDGHRSVSHYDIKTVPDRQTTLTYDWREPLSRTTSAVDLDMKLKDPLFKVINLRSSGLNMQNSRTMESLREIPEEKEGQSKPVNSSGPAALKDRDETMSKDGKTTSKVGSVKSNMSVGTQHQDLARGSCDSISKDVNSSGSAAPKDGKKTTSNEAETVPKVNSMSLNTSVGSQHVAKSCVEPQQEQPTLQRKNSIRSKVYSMLTSDEWKTSKKEEKSLQRKNSVRSQTPSESKQPVKADVSGASPVGKPSATEQTALKGQSASVSRPHSAIGGLPETERHKSLFPIDRFSPLRSSKRKIAAEQDQGSRNTLDDEVVTVPQARREKAYSRFEYFLSTENIAPNKPARTTSMYYSDKDINSPRHLSAGATHSYSTYQAQTATDNRLGRFMQRVGNLIGKNK